jgi:hypothetical protein
MDESAPIMRHRQGGSAKDYQAISPSVSAAQTTGAQGRAPGEPGARAGGDTGEGDRETQRERRDSREHREDHDAHAAGRAAANTERKEASRWAKALDKYGSVTLENKGSVARDHLALGMSMSVPSFSTIHYPLSIP